MISSPDPLFMFVLASFAFVVINVIIFEISKKIRNSPTVKIEETPKVDGFQKLLELDIDQAKQAIETKRLQRESIKNTFELLVSVVKKSGLGSVNLQINKRNGSYDCGVEITESRVWLGGAILYRSENGVVKDENTALDKFVDLINNSDLFGKIADEITKQTSNNLHVAANYENAALKTQTLKRLQNSAIKTEI